MPVARRQRRRRIAKKAARRPQRSRVPRSMGMGRGQFATIVETAEYKELNPNTDYAQQFSLAQFARASSIAPFFKWYKAAKVIFSYEPLYNTFQEQSTPGPTVPYVYMVMNRTQSSRALTLSDIQAQGARPVKFTKKIVKSYKPNWCSPGLITGAPAQGSPTLQQWGAYYNGLKAEFGWLQGPNTAQITDSATFQTPNSAGATQGLNGMTQAVMWNNNTNQTVYNGHSLYIEQNGSPSAATVCKLTVTVHWVFKDPNCEVGLAPPQTIELKSN